jgi:hypothetical protein
MSESGTVFTGNGIALYRMVTLLAGLRFEIRTNGMKLTRGRSAYAIIKSEFGLKGNKQKVYDQFERLIEEAKKGVKPGEIQPY